MDANAVVNDKRLHLAARFALLVLVPFLLGCFIFPHVQYVNGSLLSTPIGNKNTAEVLSYTFSSSDHELLLGQSVGTIFPLSNYLDFPPLVSHDRMELCFRDNGSTIMLPNGTQLAPDMQWDIHINNNQPLKLNSSSLACADIPSKGPVVYAWTARINTGIDVGSLNGSIIFNPATLTYPRLEMDYGLLQGIVMIPVFFLLVWYPLAGIHKKLRDGIFAQ